MPKQYRLTNKIIISSCAQKGKRSYSNFFIIKKQDSLQKQFAIVVSKKYDKKAVVRNRIKRQIRYILLKHINQIKNGNYLIIVKSEITITKYIEVENDILFCFK